MFPLNCPSDAMLRQATEAVYIQENDPLKIESQKWETRMYRRKDDLTSNETTMVSFGYPPIALFNLFYICTKSLHH